MTNGKAIRIKGAIEKIKKIKKCAIINCQNENFDNFLACFLYKNVNFKF